MVVREFRFRLFNRESRANILVVVCWAASLGLRLRRLPRPQPAVEYVVRIASGRLYSVVQGPSPRFEIGEAVYVQLFANDRARVTPVVGDAKKGREGLFAIPW
jgi:hypothetical protein